METEYINYRVWVVVRGGISRPTYEGYVDVVAQDPVDAGYKAKQKLHRTSFPDVGFDSFRLKTIEIRGA